jgi:malate dehydrogenase
MTVPRIFMYGAGNVGSACAAVLECRHVGKITLFDIVDDLAIGQAMDINQTAPFWDSDSKVTGTNNVADLKDADAVVVTAGAPRKEGMSREDLLKGNLKVIHEIGTAVDKYCPDAFVLVVSNPVDVLTWYLKDKWPDMKVVGLGCCLDSMRFRYFLAETLRLSVHATNGMVIGTHNDDMVPLVKHATAGGLPAIDQMSDEQIKTVIRRTKEGGTAIVRRLKTRSGFFAAGTAAAEVIESVVRNKQGVFPVSVTARGEYGYRGIALSLPCVIGEKGVHRVVDIDLDDEDKGNLDICATKMTAIVEEIKSMGNL